MASDLELRDKLADMNFELIANHDKLRKIADDMVGIGFAELINAEDEEFQVTAAFGYIEQLIMCININEDLKDEIPE